MSKWYETASFYHIYPLGLCGAPAANPYEGVEHRMRALLPWLDHIRDLGCGAIYIGPLFESSAHGYDTIDYKCVDRRLGDNEDFKTFVREAHARGLRVIVDGVFNHTGRQFFAFEDIRKNRENSPYRWWYKGINFGWNSPWNDGFSYESWRGCSDLVCLDLKNREVKDYLFDVIRFWIHEFDIDGIRLDCADCLDFDFMKEMRWMTSQEKEDFYLLGEVIHGDYARWANQEMLHSVTNYDLHKGLYSGHNDHNYFEIAHTVRRQFDENGGIYKGRVLYTFADNHDVSRLPDKLKDRGHVWPVYTLVYTLPGVPSIYYGSEWGIGGRKEDGDPALRPAIDPDAITQAPPIPGLCEYIAKLGAIRREYESLFAGRYRELLLTNKQFAFARIGAAVRAADGSAVTDGHEEAIVCAVNNDTGPADLWLPLPVSEHKLRDLISGETLEPEYDQLHLQVPADGARLIHVGRA